jgi:hypothetical protein
MIVNNIIIVGTPLLTFVLIFLYRWHLHGHEYGNFFYYLIDTLFHIEREENEKKQEDNSGSEPIPEYKKPLKFYSYQIKSSRRRTAMLLFISIFTITSSLAVFFEGVFLANEFVKPNSTCPYDYDTLDCFAYQSRWDPNPDCYFQCTPGAQTPVFFSEAICYRWVIQDITTFALFAQIGICTGMLAAFGTFCQACLALSIYVFEPKYDKSRQGCDYVCWNIRSCSCDKKIVSIGSFQRPWLAGSLIVLYILIFPVGITATLIILQFYKQGISTFTYVVAFTLFVLSLPAIMFAALDVSTASNNADGNDKTKATNKENVASSITSPTSAQRKIIKVEPSTFSNLPIRTKMMNNTVETVSTEND